MRQEHKTYVIVHEEAVKVKECQKSGPATKRGSSYRIRASVGYTADGKQVMKSKT